MNTMTDLRRSLLDLLSELDGTDVKLIVGGGFGLFLKVEHARATGLRTLLEAWPEARSTNDLDLFLRPELLIHAEKLRPMATALTKLGYAVVPGAENYQFVKPGQASANGMSVLRWLKLCGRNPAAWSLHKLSRSSSPARAGLAWSGYERARITRRASKSMHLSVSFKNSSRSRLRRRMWREHRLTSCEYRGMRISTPGRWRSSCMN